MTNDDTFAAGENSSTIRDAYDLALTASEPQPLEEGAVYAVTVPDGGRVEILDRDLDQYRAYPRRTTGRFTVRTPASLVAYLAKHGLEETELWADLDRRSVTAVINAHRGADSVPGWGDHRATLQLVTTASWDAWAGNDGKLLDQVAFAEFIEQRLPDFQDPTGADVLELAQSFQAARSGKFESSKRLTSGETTLVWVENTAAAAGKSGEIAIPDVLSLGLQPFHNGPLYKVTARFRYRMYDGRLTLGYVLERPEDVLKVAFDEVVTAISDAGHDHIYEGPAPA
jgi:uncharacterized protein YfdQ (DUF2303 family)